MNDSTKTSIDFFNASDLYILRILIEDINEYFKNQPSGVFRINFNALRFRNVATLLMFRAWIQRVKEDAPAGSLVGAYGDDEQWISLYRNFGFFKFAPPISKVSRYFDKNRIRFDENPEPKLSFDIASLMVSSSGLNEGVKNLLGSAINEAIHNVKNWAYDSFESVQGCRWWVAGVLNKSKGELSVYVRRHIKRHRFRPGPRETLLTLLVDIRRRLCGIATVVVRLSFP